MWFWVHMHSVPMQRSCWIWALWMQFFIIFIKLFLTYKSSVGIQIVNTHLIICLFFPGAFFILKQHFYFFHGSLKSLSGSQLGGTFKFSLFSFSSSRSPVSHSLEKAEGLSMLLKHFYPPSPAPNLFKLLSLEIFTNCVVYLRLYNRKSRKRIC